MDLVDSNTPVENLANLEHEAAGVAARLAAARQRADAEAQRSIEERAAPLRAEEGQLTAAMAALDDRAQTVLREAVAHGRVLHNDYAALVARRTGVRGKIQALIGKTVYDGPPPGFVPFVLSHVGRFDGEGRTGAGPAWAREEQRP